MRELELWALGEQYLRESRALNAHIRALRVAMKTAPVKELRNLESRLAVLYEEHAQLKKVGVYLQTYYDRIPRSV